MGGRRCNKRRTLCFQKLYEKTADTTLPPRTKTRSPSRQCLLAAIIAVNALLVSVEDSTRGMSVDANSTSDSLTDMNSANPLIGWVSRQVVADGGGVLLAETDELIGAESYILDKLKDRATGDKFLELIDRFYK